MKSSQIQNALYWHLLSKGHRFICPNKYVDNWFECDMLSITKSDYLHEYEVKISKADFRADFKKEDKHAILESNIKKQVLTEKKLLKMICPTYFWYTTPAGLIDVNDIPDYAGLIEVHDSGYRFKRVCVVKSAPRLNKNKVSDESKVRILESMSHRFWQMRLKI